MVYGKKCDFCVTVSCLKLSLFLNSSLIQIMFVSLTLLAYNSYISYRNKATFQQPGTFFVDSFIIFILILLITTSTLL